MTRRAPQLLALLTAALLTLSACGGLPVSDTVEPGLPVVGQPQQGVQVLPEGPEEGAGPDQVVAQFLRANIGFTDDHEVARLFLTEELGTQWSPTSRVVVYEGDPEVASQEDGSVTATIQVRGTVDESGYLTEEPPGTVRTERFGMTRVAGQWRVGDFPEGYGLWLARSDFDRLYRTATINYLGSEQDVFVPDVRWFPRYPQGYGLPTALARAQLQPPPDFLRGAVRTAAPEGLELAASGVPVDPSTGTATVELSGAGSLSEDQQVQLWGQLTRTLLQAPGVSRVRIQSGGRALEVPGVEHSLADPAEVGFADAAPETRLGILRVRDELDLIDPQHFRLRGYLPGGEEGTPTLPDVPVRWTDLAADADVRELAAVSADRTTLWRWRGQTERLMEGIGTELTPPVFDRSGGLWVAGAARSGPRVWHVSTVDPLARAVARPLEAEWLTEGTRVLQFRIGPDDHRAVVHLLDEATGAQQVALTAVVRDRQGAPVSLTAPRPVGETLVEVTSLSWASPTTLVALGRTAPEEAATPYVLPVGDWLQPLSGVDQPRVLRGVPAGDDFTMILLTEQGRLYTQEGNDWFSSRNGDDVVVPGN